MQSKNASAQGLHSSSQKEARTLGSHTLRPRALSQSKTTTPMHQLLLPAHAANRYIADLLEAAPRKHVESSRRHRMCPSCTMVLREATSIAAKNFTTANAHDSRRLRDARQHMPSATRVRDRQQLREGLWDNWRIGTCIVLKHAPVFHPPVEKRRNGAGCRAPNLWNAHPCGC